MKGLHDNGVEQGARLEYSAPQLKQWGSVAALTRLGGSGGAGDVGFNPGGNQVGSDNGSVFTPANTSGGGRGRGRP
ncbi:lasso RiPP family leader peptide-containing protein [Franzmannia qiaohouensis]|uniref:Lasso RiPP family leader peptide-containing protein n=1 Tax=Franzmannia qiaohouensis TaxID=1329370 RepID=A0ABU1HHB1_9GAMM|nr:lasso RiPP family leader peptide-containing protein [Halomonas qiaohouensis]MDR5906871.1 lasso RiPP family leader peptide-containing protein [Halomonas qiaohouensis]